MYWLVEGYSNELELECRDIAFVVFQAEDGSMRKCVIVIPEGRLKIVGFIGEDIELS